MASQDGLNFRQFNTKSVELHLMIEPSEELKLIVVNDSDKVSGSE